VIPAWAVYVSIIASGPCWAERGPAQLDHLERVAVAVSEEADDVDEVAALVAIGRSESAFAMSVQANSRGPALSDWQLEGHSGLPGPFWGLGLDRVQNAVHAALYVWRHSWQCGPRLEDRFRAYGRGVCAPMPGIAVRVQRFWAARAVMTKELANE
jgi:hypothetical protein